VAGEVAKGAAGKMTEVMPRTMGVRGRVAVLAKALGWKMETEAVVTTAVTGEGRGLWAMAMRLE